MSVHSGEIEVQLDITHHQAGVGDRRAFHGSPAHQVRVGEARRLLHPGSAPRDCGQLMRRRTHHTVSPKSASASATKMAVSIPWKVQKPSDGLYANGPVPCKSNAVGLRGPSSASKGPYHHVSRAVSAAETSRHPPRISSSFTVNQRSRVTSWVHTSRWVPCSSSRATNGAPIKMPTSTGIKLSHVTA